MSCGIKVPVYYAVFFSCLAKDVQYSSKKYINISNDSCIFVTVNPIS